MVEPKYRQLYAVLRRDIQSGRLPHGARLPSEADLGRTFKASRITVGRAVRDLQLAGLVERRAGSGTFVKIAPARAGYSFGLLIPDLGETEIFEPICQGMMASPLASQHALLWGSPTGAGTQDDRAWQLCQQYIERRVSGVFFAPVEQAADRRRAQRPHCRRARRGRYSRRAARSPRTPLPPPRTPRSRRVSTTAAPGTSITEHLLRLGASRVAFVAVPRAAATVDAREAGYREARHAAGLEAERVLIARLDPSDAPAVDAFLASARPDAIVCANDRTAGRLMPTLQRLGRRIPEDIRMVGIDDVEYAALLPVPLTTLRQPTHEIGQVALGVMLERVARTDLPARDVLLQCELVVRDSCGARHAP